MINGTYNIILNTLMGKKYGKLTLYENANRLSGVIEILGHCNQIHSGILFEGRCRFSGEFITPIRNISYLAKGDVDEKKIDLLILTETNSMPLYGEIDGINN